MTFARSVLLFAVSFSLAACASQPVVPTAPANEQTSQLGVLLMAHGGSLEWNEGVLAAIQPLQDRYVIEVAFGMADAASIQAAIARLEARDIVSVSVIRLFISGESWRERTEQILGLRPGAPVRPAEAGHAHEAGHGGHSMEFWQVQTEATFNLSAPGLADAPEMGTVLADRARTLSRDPRLEDVLILAHGPGDDSENERWIAKIDARAEAVRKLGFRRVQVETLREDWPKKRVEAEQRVRAFVQQANTEGGAAIVIPFRVHGFGPYASVLEGLDYVSDGRGLIPHAEVTRWIEGQITTLEQLPFQAPLD